MLFSWNSLRIRAEGNSSIQRHNRGKKRRSEHTFCFSFCLYAQMIRFPKIDVYPSNHVYVRAWKRGAQNVLTDGHVFQIVKYRTELWKLLASFFLRLNTLLLIQSILNRHRVSTYYTNVLWYFLFFSFRSKWKRSIGTNTKINENVSSERKKRRKKNLKFFFFSFNQKPLHRCENTII